MINKKYKDSAFRKIFKNEENFKELYKDITNKDLPGEIKFFDTRGEDGRDNVMNKKELLNDVSFMTKDNKLITLFEHQSSINENMAIRSLLYYTEILKKYINDSKNDKENKIDIHARKKVKIPMPEFYVVYNWKENLKTSEYSLSDHFEKSTKFINVVAKVHDIRYNNLTEEVKNKKDTLVGYSYFVSKIEEYKRENLSTEEISNKIIEDCKKEEVFLNYVEDEAFLIEVIDMWTIEDDKEDYKKYMYEKAYEEGKEKGIKEGIKEEIERQKNSNIKSIKAFLEDGYDLEDINRYLNLEVEEIKSIIKENKLEIKENAFNLKM